MWNNLSSSEIKKLIQKIFEDEKIPDEWKTGLIILLFKR